MRSAWSGSSPRSALSQVSRTSWESLLQIPHALAHVVCHGSLRFLSVSCDGIDLTPVGPNRYTSHKIWYWAQGRAHIPAFLIPINNPNKNERAPNSRHITYFAADGISAFHSPPNGGQKRWHRRRMLGAISTKANRTGTSCLVISSIAVGYRDGTTVPKIAKNSSPLRMVNAVNGYTTTTLPLLTLAPMLQASSKGTQLDIDKITI
ncbi:hypothetical protein QBC45DRAFT_226272 [Copromyces sp. CBS 386.78]|nr:hypothetical protein QBC45DRAFT_226272 [Copromyces sp. CBS 386.78]